MPFIWSAAADEDNAEWPSVIANLCGNNVDDGLGLSKGADSVRTCWVQLRGAFRTAGVDCVQDLRDHISRSDAAIPSLGFAGQTPQQLDSLCHTFAFGGIVHLDNFPALCGGGSRTDGNGKSRTPTTCGGSRATSS